MTYPNNYSEKDGKENTLNSFRIFATMMETPLKAAPMTPATGCEGSWWGEQEFVLLVTLEPSYFSWKQQTSSH